MQDPGIIIMFEERKIPRMMRMRCCPIRQGRGNYLTNVIYVTVHTKTTHTSTKYISRFFMKVHFLYTLVESLPAPFFVESHSKM